MKGRIRQEIERFTAAFQQEQHTATAWRRPLVGFASAEDPLFAKLKEVVSPDHVLPNDLLPKAKAVVAFFLAFEKRVIQSNVEGRIPSRQWVHAYIETNNLINRLGIHLKGYLESQGHSVALIPPTHNFDPVRLMSHWSHRHIAFVAGLGTFGLNNMLITEEGCCGRVGSFVTSAVLAPDRRAEGESCLYRQDGSCRECVARCVNAALFPDGFHRDRCYQMCLQNEARFQALGKADVCGKCLVGVPCSMQRPGPGVERKD